MATQGGHTKFKKGNPGGPGRPSSQQKAYQRLMGQLEDQLSDERVATIVREVIEKAAAGDQASVEFLFDRLGGKPKTVSDVNLNDVTQKRIVLENVPNADGA